MCIYKCLNLQGLHHHWNKKKKKINKINSQIEFRYIYLPRRIEISLLPGAQMRGKNYDDFEIKGASEE